MINGPAVGSLGYGQRECPECMARMGHRDGCSLERRQAAAKTRP